MRAYSLVMSNATVSAGKTLLWANPPASGLKEIAIARVEVGFSGDNTSRQHRLQLVTQVTAFPSVGSVTPVALDLATPASAIVGGTGGAGTCGTNASAEGAGAKTILLATAFNSLTGFLWVPGPDDRIVLPKGSASGFGVFLPDTPATTTGWHASLTWLEF